MSKIKLPPAAKLRRQMRLDGSYDMVPAYTTEEVVAIIQVLDADHDRKRRDAFEAGRRSALAQPPAVAGELWISVEDKRPEHDAIVLVYSSSWDKPKVLKFESRSSNGKPWERFIDNAEGKWYWYPERMVWTRCPLPAAPTGDKHD